jgi:hypothetical protein
MVKGRWEIHGGYGVLVDTTGREVGLLKMLELPGETKLRGEMSTCHMKTCMKSTKPSR